MPTPDLETPVNFINRFLNEWGDLVGDVDRLLDAATLAAAQGVKFMYITPSGFGGFEAHRYRDPADGWAGQVLRAGSSYDWRRAKSYTDKRILRMFQSKGGMLGGSEGGPGEAYITRVSIW